MNSEVKKPEFTKGDTDPSGDCGKFEAGIHHLTHDDNVMTPVGPGTNVDRPAHDWWQRIVVYGSSPEQAEALRDRVLFALKAQPSGVVLPDRVAMAKALCKHHAEQCGVNADDQWKVYSENFFEEVDVMLAAAPAAPAADAGLVDALGYQVLFDAIAAATSVYANGAVNISVQAFRDALAAHSAKGVV